MGDEQSKLTPDDDTANEELDVVLPAQPTLSMGTPPDEPPPLPSRQKQPDPPDGVLCEMADGRVLRLRPEDIPVYEFPEGEPKTPRQGGYCRNSWQCCRCKYHNRTGKWQSCQNPSQTPPVKLWPGMVHEQCRHQRCPECPPKNHALFPGAEHVGTRRWPIGGLEPEEKQMHLELSRQMVEEITSRDIDREAKKQWYKRPKRDPLTAQRIGPWPGGF